MELNEDVMLVSKLLMVWQLEEKRFIKEKISDDVKRLTSYSAVKMKIEQFGLKVFISEPLILMLSMCTGDNPGATILLFKELLESINMRKFKGSGIPENYYISAEDFSYAYPIEFPLFSNPKINAKYEKLWDAQKRERQNTLESDNQCDFADWWKGLMR